MPSATDKSKKSFLLKITQAVSLHYDLSFKISAILQTISLLQVLSVVFDAGTLPDRDFNKSFFGILHIILSSTGIFGVVKTFESDSVEIASIIIFIIYIAVQYGFFAYTTFQIIRKDHLSPQLTKILILSQTLHSKIIFYPIQLFIVKLINLYINCNDYSSIPIHCQDWSLILMLIIFPLNLGFSMLREFYFHQLQRSTDNAYAMKSNHFPLIILFQKSVSLCLVYLYADSRIVVIAFNILLFLINAYSLHKKLPYYNLRILRITIIVNTIGIIISCIMLAKSFDLNDHALSLVFMIIAPLMLKLSDIMLNRTLNAICRLEFSCPEQAVHFPVLLSRNTDKYALILAHLPRIKKGAFYFHGLLKTQNVKTEGIGKEDFIYSINFQLYSEAIQKCLILLKRYPDNELLILAMSQIYLENLEDAPQAIKLLRKLSKRSLSIPAKNAIEVIYAKLETLLLRICQETDTKPEYLTYLQYQERVLVLKTEIMGEISQHLNFWKEVSNDVVSAQKLLNISEVIRHKYKKIKNLWAFESKHFGTSFASVYLMYGIYLESIRGLSHLSTSLIQKGRELLLNRRELRHVLTDVLTENNAIIVASIEPDKTGQIIDTSASVNQIFNISRNKLVGSKLNAIMPKFIAERHDKLIQTYYNTFRYNLDKTTISYAKTPDEEYFPIEIILRLYPSVHNGLNVLAYIKKCSGSVPLIVINFAGKIIETSKDIQRLLNLKDLKEPCHISKICPELAKFNQAVNLVQYGKEEQVTPRIRRGSFFGDKVGTEIKSNTNIPPSSFRDESCDTADHLLLTVNRTLSHKRTSQSIITKEQAEIMYKELVDGKKFKISPLSQNSLKKWPKLDFIVQIETSNIDGECFKILKLKQVPPSRKSHQSITIMKNQISSSQIQVEIKASDARGDESPPETEDDGKYDGIIEGTTQDKVDDPKQILIRKDSQKKKDSEKSENHSFSEDYKANKGGNDQNFKEETDIEMSKLKHQISKKNSSSITNSTKKSVRIQKKFDKIFSKESSQLERRISYGTIYLTAIVIIILLSINLVFTQTSIREMERDVILLDAVDNRLYRSVISWQRLLTACLRTVGLRNISGLDTSIKNNLKNATGDMLISNEILKENVDSLDDKDIIQMFFQKSIKFWEPKNQNIFNPSELDSFAASQILHATNMIVANFNGTLLELGNYPEIFFAINNTANDYLVKAEEDNIVVGKVVVDTVNSNLQLLNILLILENLFLARVVIDILIYIRVIYMSYKRMLGSIVKIKKNKLTERIQQIQQVLNIINNDVEINRLDRVPFQTIVYTERNAKKEPEGRVKDPEKKLVLKDIVLHMLRFFMISFILFVVMGTLCITSFQDSKSYFEALGVINNRLSLTHSLGSNIAIVLPSYYFITIFQNQTSYKIRNSMPQEQFLQALDLLNKANQNLLSSFSDGINGISDPLIEKVLKSNICDYFASDVQRYCIIETNGNAFGLLGLNSKYYRSINPLMLSFLENPTKSNAYSLMDSLTPFIQYLPIVLRRSYEFLTNYLLGVFHDQTSQKLSETYKYYIILIVLNLFSAFVLRLTTAKRFGFLDIGPRKVFHVIPYNLIQENRALMFYLKKEYDKELGNTKSLF